MPVSALHKERVQRLRAELCGNRFGAGRGHPWRRQRAAVIGPVDDLAAHRRRSTAALRADLGLLMATPSFVDRLRGTGVIPPDRRRRCTPRSALSGRSAPAMTEDVRRLALTGAYLDLPLGDPAEGRR